MLRADNVICGTSTTGTGTLTLAACPSPPGGVDPYAWLTGGGFNFVSTNATFISYTIIEYTDATFATAKQFEKGVGLCTLGANIGATTLARTKVQQTGTGMNTSTPTMSSAAPGAVTIGTAANTLVFVGASASDVLAFDPWFSTTDSFDNLGVGPLAASNGANAPVPQTNGNDFYVNFLWATPMLVKRVSVAVATAYTGGTPISNVYAGLYAYSGTQGRPGKLLYDFGLLGTSNASLNATGNVSSGASGSGIWLTPGEYIVDFATFFSGGSTTPALVGATASNTASIVPPGRFGTFGSGFNFPAMASATASSATSGARPGSANVTGFNTAVSSFAWVNFLLKDS